MRKDVCRSTWFSAWHRTGPQWSQVVGTLREWILPSVVLSGKELGTFTILSLIQPAFITCGHEEAEDTRLIKYDFFPQGAPCRMGRRANIREDLGGSYGRDQDSEQGGGKGRRNLKKNMEADRLLSKEVRKVVFSV